ncbi:MAG: hypothetical protein RSB95_03565 [Bacilli bacterium]
MCTLKQYMEKEKQKQKVEVKTKKYYSKYRSPRTGEDIDMLRENNSTSSSRSICDISEDGA